MLVYRIHQPVCWHYTANLQGIQPPKACDTATEKWNTAKTIRILQCEQTAVYWHQRILARKLVWQYTDTKQYWQKYAILAKHPSVPDTIWGYWQQVCVTYCLLKHTGTMPVCASMASNTTLSCSVMSLFDLLLFISQACIDVRLHVGLAVLCHFAAKNQFHNNFILEFFLCHTLHLWVTE